MRGIGGLVAPEPEVLSHHASNRSALMITLVFCLRRLPELSREAFLDRWLHGHGPLVAERAGVLRIARYVQSHTFDDPRLAGVAKVRHAPEPFDGITQVSWASMEDLAATFDDPRAATAVRELLEDELHFIDLPRSPIFFSEEHVVVGR
jgi:hypothetical protein